MHVSYTFLKVGAAAACWVLAGLSYEVPRSSAGAVEPHNPLAICRSAYGSLIARLMKDSLEAYWHGGTCSDPTHDHGQGPGGRLAKRQDTAHHADHDEHGEDHNHAGHPDEHADHEDHDDHDHPAVASSLSWVDRCGRGISQLEHMRSVRNSPFAVAPTHRLFLSAAADWRVHIAWELDPGDSALYEIDHFVSVARATTADAAKKKADELAQRTIQHALSPQAGPVDALTGAGAVINLLNDELLPGRAEPPKTAEVLHNWRVLKFCLNRHRELRREADEQDWWNDIPDVRRTEIETYAKMLERLSVLIQKQLASNGTVAP